MRPAADYTAQTVIKVNGVRAFNVGDDVPQDVVDNLGLVVGRDVMPAGVNVIPRPAGGARRADWEAYWLGQGLSAEEIDGMTRDEMAAREPEFAVVEQPPPVVIAEPAHPQPDLVADAAAEQTAAVNEPAPPGPHALKAEWVDYAVARGLDRQTAEDSTIAQLAEFDYGTAFGPR